MSDRRRLAKAIIEVGAYMYQARMAAMLLAVNGIDNALDFVYGLQARGLTSKAKNTGRISNEEVFFERNQTEGCDLAGVVRAAGRPCAVK